MNGTLKSLFGWVALWVCGGFAWGVIVGVSAALAGPGRGDALNFAMATSWASALFISMLIVGLAKAITGSG